MKSPLRWAAIILGICLYPALITGIDTRGIASPLRISLKRSTPALAAHEDLKLTFAPKEYFVSTSAARLRTGVNLNMDIFRRHIPAMKLESINSPQVAQAPVAPAWQTLRGMRLSANASADSVQPRMVAGLSAAGPRELRGDFSSEVPLELRKKKLLEHFAQDQWKSPTLAEKAQALMEQEGIQPNREQPQERMLVSASGNPIYVKTREPAPRPATPAPSPLKPTPPPQPNPGWIPASLDAERSRPFQISGQLQMSGGVAFTGADSFLTVSRLEDGRIQESGQVWIRDARFELAAKALSGYLVAELRNARGEVLGRGEYDLYDIPTPRPQELKVRDINLVIKPVVSGMSVNVISADSYGRYKLPVPGAQLEAVGLEADFDRHDETTFVSGQLIEGSSLLVRAGAANFWGTSAIGLWNSSSDVQLFSQSKVRALLNLVLSEEEIRASENYAVVWGRVTDGGAPASGAQVELAGDGMAHAIYFNEAFIPDRRLEATTSNGYFVFVMVTPGIHSVRAKINRGLLPAQVIPADRHSISYVDLDFGSYRTAGVKVFDPLMPNKTVFSTVTILGTDAELDLRNQDQIQYVSGSGHMVLEADPGPEYELSRIFVSRQATQIDIPAIARTWLTELVARRKINLDVGTGIVVGLVADEDFTVSMDLDAHLQPSSVVYVDAQGSVLPQQSSGIAGGGFAIFNVPMGYRTLAITPKGAGRMFTQALVADDRYVTVLSTKLNH